MPAIISRNSVDVYNTDIVSVITSFDTEGRIKPLYVRIGEDSLKIHSSWQKSSLGKMIDFQCQVIDQGILKPLILTFHLDVLVWTIPKIQQFS